MIEVPDGRYLALPKWQKRGALINAGALVLPDVPKTIDHLGDQDALILVVSTPTHDAALLCDQAELDRVWRSIDAGDDRPIEAFLIKRDRLNVAG